MATDLGGKVNVLRHGAGQKRKLIAGRGFVSDLFGGLASNLLKDGVGMAGNLLKDGLKSGLSKGLDFAKSEKGRDMIMKALGGRKRRKLR